MGCSLVAYSTPGQSTPPLKSNTYIDNSGGNHFGSLHDFHVIHCGSRKYTWKADLFYVMDGVGHYIEKFWETFRCHDIEVM